MAPKIAELIGFILTVVGCFGLVAAAAMVSVALAVLVAALLLVIGGIVTVYVASLVAASSKPKAQS